MNAPKKIEELTPAQDAKLEEYYQAWLAIGLQTGKRDHAVVENALTKAYVRAGLKPPTQFVWGRSPVETARIVDKEAGDGAGSPSNAGYGAHDASWLGFYSFMREELGLKEETEELVDLIDAAIAGSGWFWPFENVCFCSELPTAVHLDEEGRLHCENGPAIAFDDGVEVYAWRNVLVDKEIILHPENLTSERISKEENAEIRRVMLERFGAGKYIEELGLKPVAEDETGKLLRADLSGDEALTVVRVEDPTDGRVYFLRVPPDTATAKAGVAWTFGVPEAEYKPVKHT